MAMYKTSKDPDPIDNDPIQIKRTQNLDDNADKASEYWSVPSTQQLFDGA